MINTIVNTTSNITMKPANISCTQSIMPGVDSGSNTIYIQRQIVLKLAICVVCVHGCRAGIGGTAARRVFMAL